MENRQHGGEESAQGTTDTENQSGSPIPVTEAPKEDLSTTDPPNQSGSPIPVTEAPKEDLSTTDPPNPSGSPILVTEAPKEDLSTTDPPNPSGSPILVTEAPKEDLSTTDPPKPADNINENTETKEAFESKERNNIKKEEDQKLERSTESIPPEDYVIIDKIPKTERDNDNENEKVTTFESDENPIGQSSDSMKKNKRGLTEDGQTYDDTSAKIKGSNKIREETVEKIKRPADNNKENEEINEGANKNANPTDSILPEMRTTKDCVSTEKTHKTAEMTEDDAKATKMKADNDNTKEDDKTFESDESTKGQSRDSKKKNKMRTTISEQENKIKRLEDQYEDAQIRIDMLTTSMNSLKEQIQKTDLDTSNRLKEANHKLNEAEQNNITILESHKDLEEKLKNAKEDKTEIEERLAEKSGAYTELAGENYKLERKNLDLTKKLEDMKKNQKCLMDEIDKLKKETNKQAIRIKEHEKWTTEQELKQKQMKKSLEEEQKKLKTMEDKAEDLAKECKRYKAYENHYYALNQQYKQLNNRLQMAERRDIKNKETIEALNKQNEVIHDEKQELLLRLSKLAGANLTLNNPNIADLSDEKRPTKLAEEFSELYDNEWTDAFEVMEDKEERDKTTYMLFLLKRASDLCHDISDTHIQDIKKGLCHMTFRTKLVLSSEEDAKSPTVLKPNEYQQTQNTETSQDSNSQATTAVVENAETRSANDETLHSNSPATNAVVENAETRSANDETLTKIVDTTDQFFENSRSKQISNEGSPQNTNDDEVVTISEDMSSTCNDTRSEFSNAQTTAHEETEGTFKGTSVADGSSIRKQQTDLNLHLHPKQLETSESVSDSNVENPAIKHNVNTDETEGGRLQGNESGEETSAEQDASFPESTTSEPYLNISMLENEHDSSGDTGVMEALTQTYSKSEQTQLQQSVPGFIEAKNKQTRGELNEDNVSKTGLNMNQSIPIDDSGKQADTDDKSKVEYSEKLQQSEPCITTAESIQTQEDSNEDLSTSGGSTAEHSGNQSVSKTTGKNDSRDQTNTDDKSKFDNSEKENALALTTNTDDTETSTQPDSETKFTQLQQSEPCITKAETKQEDLNEDLSTSGGSTADHCGNQPVSKTTEKDGSRDQTYTDNKSNVKYSEQVKEIIFNFDSLQNVQKKTVMELRKFIEINVSHQIEEDVANAIAAENKIDVMKEEMMAKYIKKCVNVCWSMCRHEPPVHIEFPDIQGDQKFDSNVFKPYTKSGKRLHYVVWPALFLHKDGPMLSKGVAQGR